MNRTVAGLRDAARTVAGFLLHPIDFAYGLTGTRDYTTASSLLDWRRDCNRNIFAVGMIYGWLIVGLAVIVAALT